MSVENPELTIVLRLGARTRSLPLIALAAALHLSREDLFRILSGLLFAFDEVPVRPSPFPGEPTEGKRSITFPKEEYKERSLTLRSIEGKGDRGEGNSALTAEFLAGVLDDEANLPALRVLVATSPSQILDAALAETLAVPNDRIRRTRAAYFTAAVHRRLRAGTTSPEPSYA